MDIRISNVEENGNVLSCFIRYIFTTKCVYLQKITHNWS